MPIIAGRKYVTDVFYGSSPISQIFHGASLVWQKRLSRIAGYEAATAYLVGTQAVTKGGVTLSKIMEEGETADMTVPFTDEGREVRLWALMGDESEVLWVQDDGRVCLRATVTGGQLTVESQGNRKEVLSYTVPWPGGMHWVTLNSANDWYGYQLGLFLDGARVQYATNGGAFKLSERVFMPGTTRLTTSGDVAVISVDWSPVKNGDEEITNFEPMVRLNSFIMKVETSGEWTEIYPGARIRMWLVGGGEGGQGGQGGKGGGTKNTGYSGSSGSDGRMGKYVEVVPAVRSGTLVIGKGGAGGAGGAGGDGSTNTLSGDDGAYGKAGKLGEPTTLGGFTSDSGTVVKSNTTTVEGFGWSMRIYPLGYGGSGGSGGSGGELSADGSSGNSGNAGYSGGLIVAYQWPKP